MHSTQQYIDDYLVNMFHLQVETHGFYNSAHMNEPAFKVFQAVSPMYHFVF